MLQKLLDPRAYIRRLKRLWLDANFKFNKHFVCTADVLEGSIHFLVDTRSEYEMRLKGSYTGEPTTLFWIDRIVGADDCVYDIGANVGAYALLIGRCMRDKGGEGIVYAMEPESGNFFKLNRNIQLNELSEYIFPVCAALGSSNGLQKFHLSSLEIGSACHGLGEPKSEGQIFCSKHQQGVAVFSLDSFVQQEGVRFPNHIKIDVDGLEKTIIASGLSVLRDPRLKSLMIEVNELCSDGAVEQMIQESGLELLRSDVWKGPDTVIHNLLFVRK